MVNGTSHHLLRAAEDVLPSKSRNALTGHISFCVASRKTYPDIPRAHALVDNTSIPINHIGFDFEALIRNLASILGPDRLVHLCVPGSIVGALPIPQPIMETKIPRNTPPVVAVVVTRLRNSTDADLATS